MAFSTDPNKLYGLYVFFFQAEDGIRDIGVTGVQTCALPISKQEVKQEHKELEGNPEIKGRVRRLQREMARRRMLAAVPKATVVITNPTHVAVDRKSVV